MGILMSVSIEQAVAAVAALPRLQPPVRPGGLAALDDPAAPALAPAPQPSGSAATVGNSLVSFTSEVSPTHATELQYAVGFAQLHAVQTGGFDPLKDPLDYFKYVQNMLTNIGFVGQGYAFSDFSLATATVQLDQVVLQVLGGLLTADALAVATSAVKALEDSADSGGAPWTIFSSHSQSTNQGTFSLGTANETNGQVALKISAFQMTGAEETDKFLWASYSSTSLSIQYADTTLTLNDNLWNSPGVGDTVTSQMQALSAGYIAGLPPLKPA